MNKKINLEEILNEVFEPSSQDCTTPTQDLQLAITLNPDLNSIKKAMKEACRQALELAAENAKVGMEYRDEDISFHTIVNKQSILNTINEID